MALSLPPASAAADAPNGRFKIIGFSKEFQTLNAEDIADIVAEIGWDGIECFVRPKG